MVALSRFSDRPRVTVAGLVARENRFLFVEERDSHGGLVLNQPAGHLESGESVLDGLVREVFEETACRVRPLHLVGVYTWQVPDSGLAFLRIAVAAEFLEEIPEKPLDEGIERALWLTPDQVIDGRSRHRSPLVLRCLEDALAGACFDLSVFKDLRA